MNPLDVRFRWFGLLALLASGGFLLWSVNPEPQQRLLPNAAVPPHGGRGTVQSSPTPQRHEVDLFTSLEVKHHVEELGQGGKHVYLADLHRGDFLHLELDAYGRADLRVDVYEPDSTRPLVFDRPGDPMAKEEAAWVVPREGKYRIEVSSWTEDPSGLYALRLAALDNPATERQQLLNNAFRAASKARDVRNLAPRHLDGIRDAIDAQLEAVALWSELGDRDWAANLYFHAGRLALGVVQREDSPSHELLLEGERHLRQAIHLYEELGHEGAQAVAYSDLGTLYNHLNDLSAARASFANCVDKARDLPIYRPTLTTCFQHLGLANRRLGRLAEARHNYRQAIDLWHRQNEPCSEASTRSALGNVYRYLGLRQLALEEQERALALSKSSCSRQTPIILTKLADALARMGQEDEAFQYLEEALELRRRLGDLRGEAVTLQSQANLLLERDPVGAERLYRRALGLFRRFGGPGDQSTCLRALCALYERSGKLEMAADCYVEALAAAHKAGRPHDRAALLFGQARLARRRGDLLRARQRVEQALQIIETVREHSGTAISSAYYLSSKQDYFTFLVSVLVDMHHRDPNGGHDQAAFQASESSRARGLLDTLRWEKDALHEVDYAEHRQRLASLEAEISRLHASLLPQPSADDRGPGSTSRLDSKVRQRFAEMEERVRQVSRRFAVARPRTTSVQQLRDQHLDDDTLLLEYLLGQDRSYLWAITHQEFRLRDDLPSESVVRRATDALRRRIVNREKEILGSELSSMLLEPVADLLSDHSQLVIVPHGALYGIPFIALPHPDSLTGPALNATHRVSFLPSVAIFVTIRQKHHLRPVPDLDLVAVGDAIYEAEDARRLLNISVEAHRAQPYFGPLRYSGLEVDTLTQHFRNPAKIRLYRGFDAHRRLIENGTLERARVLHFAVHAVTDSQHPELSSLVVSRYDTAGQPVEGYLRAYEIARLNLAAELVVLSACETGLGTEIKGEGWVGLTQAFIQAGAPAVLVSQWPVDDAMTAELMGHFYRYLAEGTAPIEALRQAQSILRQRRLAPFYWAGLTLVGDWR